MSNIIHDLKVERANVSAGLPAAYKLVPALFHIIAAASILLGIYFYLSKKAYENTQMVMQERLSTARSEETNLVSQQQTIVTESENAEGIARWLEGSRPIQPITASIGRSMSKDATIAELSLDRNPEIPAHTFMQFKIDGGGSEQIETTLSSVYALDYQTYSAQQVKGNDSVDFQATLIHSDK